MASHAYNQLGEMLLNGDLDWVNDDIRVAMTTSSYTPDVAAHDYLDDITNELAGTGYVRKALASKAVVTDGNYRNFDAANPTWTGLDSGTPHWAIVYLYNAGGDGSSELLFAIELDDTPSNGGDYTVQWNGESSNATVGRLNCGG